jgi:pimeloyl-ACP methyl ester carboxylesterase
LLASLPVDERRIELNGIPTAVLEGGRGGPVILLHGPGGYAAHWFRVIPDLVATNRVILPDLPGHGASDVPDGPLDHEVLGAWLEELIESCCEAPPVLIGHVLGGAVAARFAVERRKRLSQLILVDSLGLAPFRPTPEFGQALGAFMAHPTESSHAQLWDVCAHDFDALREGLGEAWEWLKAYNLECAQNPQQAAAVKQMMEESGMPAIPPTDLERIDIPTSLIWGRHDLANPLSVAEAASSRYGWPLQVIENSADDPSLDQPEAFLKALREMIGTGHPG